MSYSKLENLINGYHNIESPSFANRIIDIFMVENDIDTLLECFSLLLMKNISDNIMRKVINYIYENKNEIINSEQFLLNIKKYYNWIDLIDLSELEKIPRQFSIIDYLIIYRQNKIKLLLANMSNDNLINCANRFNFVKSESFIKMILEQSDIELLKKYKKYLEPELYQYYVTKVLDNDDESSFDCLLWFMDNFNNINISIKMKDITDAYENDYNHDNIQLIKLYWYLKGICVKNV